MDFKTGTILSFDKPLTWTSFGLVSKVRYLLCKHIGEKKLKVGHAGTLDPLATGVLIVCTGKATKQIDTLQAKTKEYVATLQLGATTPSFDLETEVDATYPTTHINKEKIEEALKKFIGEEELKFRIAAQVIKLPLFGRIIIDLEMCKYVRTLSILIGNHVEIIRTVRISGKIISNPVIAKAFSTIDRKLKGGDKLSAALAGNPFVPSGMTPMLRVGEESGNVGPMLEKIAGNLESDTKLKIKRLLSLFEPAVIVFLAVVVLVVVVSIFVAMMEINSISQGGPSL